MGKSVPALFGISESLTPGHSSSSLSFDLARPAVIRHPSSVISRQPLKLSAPAIRTELLPEFCEACQGHLCSVGVEELAQDAKSDHDDGWGGPPRDFRKDRTGRPPPG
jgi:hypothetical protein